ncbi:WD-repeat protein [Aspergillus eucalypticola CBS 122712]|uniref:WD-repeat protein n=1 Tax=Aspergillus eucalypticola (strain CBS 122712 / IBT 29274) TaxID=1448314 RepID=A0A317VGY0_ASPEC|nr:WD-repeat protein [Aspergillus eucalypticola CBS 122712]PWY72679.1 WD-repeat protein [Aspergillus eucalypticola CBS 122712]
MHLLRGRHRLAWRLQNCLIISARTLGVLTIFLKHLVPFGTMGGEAIVGPALSGQFYAGTGKQYNFGSVSGEKVYMGTGDVQIFSTLHFAKSACFNSREREHDSFCLEGTRVDLLKDIAEWIDADHNEGIFWLSGMVGTGKTTIARTVARNYDQQSRLAASFFFTDANGDASSADSFASTVACQLANFDTSMKNAIQDVLERCPLLPYQGLSEQWTRLVKEPLMAFTQKHDKNSMLIVVDGLDLCPDKNDQRLTLRLLSGITRACENKVLVFLASRPESAIRSQLSEIQHRRLKLQNIEEKVVNSDISIFLDHEIGKLVAPFEAELAWDGGIVATLVYLAHGLFLWAATACLYVRGAKNHQIMRKRLRDITQKGREKGSPTEQLYQIYTSVLDGSVNEAWNKKEKETYWKSISRVLWTHEHILGCLPKRATGKLIRVDIDSMLEDLHSIVTVPEDGDTPINFLHTSFTGYLGQLGHPDLHLTRKQSHCMLADACLDLLNEACGQDGSNLRNLVQHGGEPKTQNIPQELEYACTQWVEHLYFGGEPMSRNTKAFVFLETHGKSWIQLLALSNRLVTVNSMRILLHQRVEDNPEEDKRFIHDLLSTESISEISAQCQRQG